MKREQFAILADFLENYGNDVEGRASEPPDAEVQLLLRRFARGEVSPLERTKLADLLKDRPQWLIWLAQEVKSRRAHSVMDSNLPEKP